jgi:hypothetical protein
MALLYEICKRRGTTIVIASQYDVSPLLIAESDQLRIEYRKGILSNFHSTIAELSNDSSKFFQRPGMNIAITCYIIAGQRRALLNPCE